jgi:5-methylcytosine-specific restriction endonuclease McrA
MPWHKHRPDTAHHYRSAAFKRIRKRLLAGNPDCAICGERPARIADHRTPICEGGPTTPENLQAICQPCSLSKTGKEGAAMRAAKRRARQRQERKA